MIDKFFLIKMLTILVISSLFATVFATGQLSIIRSPDSLDFKGNDALNSDSLADVYAASLGYTIERPSEWRGLYINDPFNPAKTIISVVVDGLTNIRESDGKTKTYDLIGSSAQESIDSLVYRIQEHNAVAVDLDLTSGLDTLVEYHSVLGDLKPNYEKIVSSLKPHIHPEDKLFLQQISVINELATRLTELKDVPALITVRLSLAPLIAAHASSPAMTDALKLLRSATDNLFLAAEKIPNSVVSFVALQEDFVRTKRATPGAKQSTEDLNLAKAYSSSYPVIFNIILWFGVIMTFSLLAISYAIAGMDPGRDSIIYRMTSTRMKKDN